MMQLSVTLFGCHCTGVPSDLCFYFKNAYIFMKPITIAKDIYIARNT